MHIAFSIPKEELWNGLIEAEKNGLVSVNKQGNLHMFTYTNECSYSGSWNLFTRAARGIIINSETKEIVALPFPKFFNLSENKDPIPDLPFSAYEKLDGSLIVLWWNPFENFWQCSTKGSFSSDQAKMAQSIVNGWPNKNVLHQGTTYLMELIGPKNKIVVNYPSDELVMLGGYALEPNSSIDFDYFKQVGEVLGIRSAKKFGFSSISDLVNKADHELTKDEEGFVVHFENDLRVKIKSAEYKRIHAIISKLSPLSVWGLLKDMPDQVDNMRKELPEEFWTDFDMINFLLKKNIYIKLNKIAAIHNETKHLSDKELGLRLNSIDPEIRPFVFPYRKAQGALTGAFREAIYRSIRPTSNRLEGYLPSGFVSRAQGETE